MKIITYKTFTSIKEVNQNNWDFNSENLYLSYDYLFSIEKTVDKISKFYYTLYLEGDKIIGKSVFQLINYQNNVFDYDELPCSISEKLVKNLMNRPVNVLVLGTIFATGENSFYLPTEYYSLLNESAMEIQKLSKAKFILIKEFYPSTKSTSVFENEFRYYPIEIDANMVLTLQNSPLNLETYLQGFKTKYRSKIKGISKKSSVIEVKEFSIADLVLYKNQMNKLYDNVMKNTNFSIGSFGDNTIEELKKSLGDKFKVDGYFLNEELIAFKTAYISKNKLDAGFIGLNYDYSNSHFIYQRILLDYLEYTIDNNLEVLEYGRTAETIKSCFGAEPINMKLYLKGNNKFRNLLIKYALKYVKPNEYNLRSPKKKIN